MALRVVSPLAVRCGALPPPLTPPPWSRGALASTRVLVLLDGGTPAPDGVSQALLAWALDAGVKRIAVLDIGELAPADAAAVRRTWPVAGREVAWRGIDRPSLLAAIEVLDRAGATGRQLQLLYGIAEAADVSRLRALLRASPDLRRGFESGRLSLAHVARIVALPPSQQRELATLARTRAMSVRQLEARRRSGDRLDVGSGQLPAGPADDAGTQAFAAVLGAALGADVELRQQALEPGPMKWDLIVAFYDVEALAGVLERIGSGVAPGAGGAPGARRVLRIEGLAAGELDGLVGHLVGEQ